MEHRALVSWSGGKDSFFACMQAQATGIRPCVLLNVLTEEGQVSRSHGIPAPILEAQATALGLPIHLVASSWRDYETKFTRALIQLKTEHNLSCAIFGDIDLEEHRSWEEKVCARADLSAVLPLWRQNRRELVLQILDYGVKATIVSCNDVMGEEYLGRLLTPGLIRELEEQGIDPCGENGEYHTLVVDAPLFSFPLSVAVTQTRQHEGYWFSQLQLSGQ